MSDKTILFYPNKHKPHESKENLIDLMDMESIDELLDQEIKSLDEKIKNFRSEFNDKFCGYSPEFLSDILFVQNIKI